MKTTEGEETPQTSQNIQFKPEEKTEDEVPQTSQNIQARSEEKKYLEGEWGWLVVFGSALSHFFIVGTPRSFGIYYEELLVRYERSASETAWVIALSNTMRMLFGRSFVNEIKNITGTYV